MTMQVQALRLGKRYVGTSASLLLRRRMSGSIMMHLNEVSASPTASSTIPYYYRRHLSSSSSDLPYHIVMGLPALSPTMESGALAEWYVNEGDAFAAGDAVAKIETDKASIDFEAQDDGYVAKILATAGDGKDLAIGTPIMISVEEAEHVKAFVNYVQPTTTATAAPVVVAAVPTPAPPKAAAAPVAAAVAPPVVVSAVTPPPPPAVPVAAPTPVAAPPPPVASIPVAATAAPAMNIATAWGSSAIKSSSSPLAKTLEANHLAYIEKYGTTGQRPSL